MSTHKPGLFPALLKYWRGQRGVSQLDLALTADVSSRHISFMETGRAKPSRQMVLQLASALHIPLRDQNALLLAAGFEEAFANPTVDEALAGPLGSAVTRMMKQHDPYPMLVLDRLYNVLRANQSATSLLSGMIAEPEALALPMNAFDMLFDPRLARPFVEDWAHFARALLSRLQQEALRNPSDTELAAMVDRMLAYPNVPDAFRKPDFSQTSPAVFTLTFARDGRRMSFLTMVTRFSAPQNVTLEELMIESYFPLDEATEVHCQDAFRT